MKKLHVNFKNFIKSKNYKIVQKIDAIVLASILSFTPVNSVYAIKEQTPENEIGYENINPFINFKVSDENFVILDVGNHEYTGTNFQNKKLSYCDKNDISIGIIISSKACTENEIYDDIEYTKTIVSTYNIDFPIYLDINEIITNNDLNVEQKTKIITNFLEKCSANGMYVGIYGTDTNLCRVKHYCGINNYDAFLVMDKQEIEYKGTYNVYKDLNGEIHATMDLSKTITNKNLNDSENFYSDGTYVATKDDDLVDISLKSGMSVNQLLEFNNLKKKDIKEGTIIRIPSIINKVLPTPSTTLSFELLEKPIRGCDIYYGDEITDWDKFSENFEFAILKASQGTDKDIKFDEFAKGCSINNIAIGAYCFNNYTSHSCKDIDTFIEKQNIQADFFLDCLKNKNIEYPAYLDIEPTINGSSVKNQLTKEQINTMLDIWCNKMTSSGYIPGVYCNQDTLKYINECIDYDLTEKFHLWLAGGDYYKNEENHPGLSLDVLTPGTFDKDFGATIAQTTNVATNCGASNFRGHLDVNFSWFDYTKTSEINYDEYDFELKSFIRKSEDLINISIVLVTTATGIIVYKVLKKKIKEEERKTKRKLYRYTEE